MKSSVLLCLLAACTFDLAESSAPAAGDMQFGVVSGRIYDDLRDHPGARMSDLAALGVHFLRVEIEAGVDVATYRAIVDTARRYDIEVLALVQSTAIGEDPLREDIELYAQHITAKIDSLVAAIPNLRYIEVENEPDGYDFRFLDDDHAAKLGLLMVRVFEHAVTNRTGDGRPQIVGFDFSRADDGSFQNVYDSAPIANHRRWRPSVGLPDGLPVDIISIHAYGNEGKLPEESGYSYIGTLRDALGFYFGQTFSTPGPDGNRSLFNATPVWVTELGFSWDKVGGLDRQAQGIQQGFAMLRDTGRVQVAFAYDYRDDERNQGTETAGLRANSDGAYAEHPAYYAFQQLTGGRGTTFTDVGPRYWAHDEIEEIFARGITVGCAGSYRARTLEFCPERNVSETEIDTFIERARGGTGATPGDSPAATRAVMACKLGDALGAYAPYRGTFVDVFPDTPCVHQIEGLHDLQVAKGWQGTGEFQPWNLLTRAEMSTFLARAYHLK